MLRHGAASHKCQCAVVLRHGDCMADLKSQLHVPLLHLRTTVWIEYWSASALPPPLASASKASNEAAAARLHFHTKHANAPVLFCVGGINMACSMPALPLQLAPVQSAA